MDLVKRLNRTLIKMFCGYIVTDDEYNVYLGCVTGSYRSIPQESTGLTPNLLIFVRSSFFRDHLQT